jgi:hypothetical protein
LFTSQVELHECIKERSNTLENFGFFHYYRTPKFFNRHRFRLDVMGRHLEKFIEQKRSCITLEVFSA